MNIVNSENYLLQFKKLVYDLVIEDIQNAKKFKLYVDTVVLNLATKLKKYKQSHYFDDENIKDIQHEGYTITFYVDEPIGVCVLLGIIKK